MGRRKLLKMSRKLKGHASPMLVGAPCRGATQARKEESQVITKILLCSASMLLGGAVCLAQVSPGRPPGVHGVVRRIAGPDDYGLFELAEEFSSHHHHLVCAVCGKVEDIAPSERLERALNETVRALGEAQGYEVIEHRVELLGFCPQCIAR